MSSNGRSDPERSSSRNVSVSSRGDDVELREPELEMEMQVMEEYDIDCYNGM